MKHPEDNKTVDWVDQPKPKYIETELGREKLCIQCDEYWPLDDEFWFHRNVKLLNGQISKRYEAACKCCYDVHYRPNRFKSKGSYQVKSNYVGATA